MAGLSAIACLPNSNAAHTRNLCARLRGLLAKTSSLRNLAALVFVGAGLPPQSLPLKFVGLILKYFFFTSEKLNN